MADNVEVRIVGDASGVAPAVEEAGASVGGLRGIIADINAFLDITRAKFAQVGVEGAAAGHAIAGGMAEAVVGTEAEGNAITRMIMKVHQGAESVRTFQMRAKEFAEIYVALFAVEAITHWVEALGQAAEKTEHLSAIMGMSVGQVQALSGAATMSGTSIDTLSKAIAIMDNKALNANGSTSSAAKAFHAMGISANDGRTNMERLLKVADKFHGMEDGPTKVALSMQLFGRAGKEAIPFLNQGSEAIQQLMDKTKELGGVNEAAVAQGARMASSLNEAKVAWEGLKNTLTQAFGPVLTELVDGFVALVKAMNDSYQAGGVVKVVFDGISMIIQGIIEILYDVGLAFSQIFKDSGGQAEDWDAVIKEVVHGVVDAFKNVIVAVVFVADAFIAAFKLISAGASNFQANWIEQTGQIKTVGVGLGEFMKVVGKVCEDALMLHWGSIAADWDAGMAHVHQVVQQRTDQILAETAHLRQQAQSDFSTAMGLGKSFDEFQKNIFSGHYAGPGHDAFKFKFGGGGGDAPDIAGSGKGTKGKDETVQKLEQELEAKKAAWEKEQIAQGTAQQFSLQSEADFWDNALKRTDLSAKARFEITKKWIHAEQALQKDRISAVLDEDKRELFAADKNAQAKLAILQREQAFIRRMYGEQSKEARAADYAVLQAQRDAAEQSIQLTLAVAKARADAANAYVNDAEKQAEFEAEMGRISQGKLLQAERQFEQQRYQIDLQALQLRRSLIDPTRDPVAYQQVSLQIEALERQHQQKLTQIDRQAALQRTQIQRQAIQQVAATFGDHISKMITLQEGWREGLVGIYQGLVQTVANVLEQIIEKWIAAFLIKLILGKQETGQSVANSVAQAGAAGVASWAGAPWPIDAGAPAFGASMAAAAASFGTVAAAEDGDWNVREGLYHLHENEMVLPSWAASPLRSMIESSQHPSFMLGRGDATRAGGGGGGGDAHYHYAPTLNHSDTTWDSMMRRSDREARRWFASQWRNGRLLPQDNR